MIERFTPMGIAGLVVMWVSLGVHEWAHAWSAYKLGDYTAKGLGRLTLNPFAHVDLVGTFLLPLLGVPFGWAKPVPVDPSRFRRGVSMSYGMMLTAAAGPISNFALATIAIVADAVLWRVVPDIMAGALGQVLLIAISTNVVLGVFNFIPIPPLDGSRVVNHFLPYSMRDVWHQIERLGLFLPIALILGMQWTGLNPFGPVLRAVGWIIGFLRP